MGLFQQGEFVLHSGERSDFRIDCNALTAADIEALAAQLRRRLPEFREVAGVPSGGERLAAALAPFATGQVADLPLIVDDVYTTGSSMAAWRGQQRALGAVLFARRAVAEPWILPLFTMTREGGAREKLIRGVWRTGLVR